MQVISSFVSYAHDDAADAGKLGRLLEPLLKTSARYEFSPWSDRAILPGEFWRKEIEEALERAHFGLLRVVARRPSGALLFGGPDAKDLGCGKRPLPPHPRRPLAAGGRLRLVAGRLSRAFGVVG